MAYNISALDAKLKNYLDANKAMLLSNAIFGADSTKLMTIQTGVKAQTPIIVLSNDVVLQNGKTCTWDAEGSTVYTNRMLNPEYQTIMMSWCDKDMLDTWANAEVNIAAGNEKMPFEEKIVTDLNKRINAIVEKLIWQGNKTSGTGNMARMNGLKTVIDADVTSGVIASSQVIAKGSDDIYTRVKKLYLATPDNIANEAECVMSIANYKALVIKLMEMNLYHYDEKENAEMTLTFPGTNFKVRAIAGLDGVDSVYVLRWADIVYGTDLQNDKETFQIWYSQDNLEFRFKCNFATAIQYAFPENILINE